MVQAFVTPQKPVAATTPLWKLPPGPLLLPQLGLSLPSSHRVQLWQRKEPTNGLVLMIRVSWRHFLLDTSLSYPSIFRSTNLMMRKMISLEPLTMVLSIAENKGLSRSTEHWTLVEMLVHNFEKENHIMAL